MNAVSKSSALLGPLRILAGLLLALVALVLLWLLVTSALWGAWLAVAALASLLVALCLLRSIRLSAVALVFCAVAAVPTVNHATDAMAAMRARVIAQGPATLTQRERLALWTGNGAMALAGCGLGFCVAAVETLALWFPGPAERRIDSDWPMISAWVRGHVDRHAEAAAKGRWRFPDEGVLYTRFAGVPGWGSGVASATGPLELWNEAAAAMALGGGRLHLEPLGDGRIGARFVLPVRYDAQAYTPVFDVGWVRLRIEDSLFWALQELGWLHPFTLTYAWTVSVDDAGRVIGWDAGETQEGIADE